MNKQNIALIDIGSNSIRLVIFSLDYNGYYKEIQNLKVVARLSSHLDEARNITQKGIDVLLECLKYFQEITRTYKITKIKCVATAAIRQANNQQQILKQVKEMTDFQIRILSEYEEAFYGYLAVTNSTNIQNGITVDIGGGSTEVTIFKNRKLLHYHSFPFGAISLKQEFIHNEIPTYTELQELKTFLISQFLSVPWISENNLPLVGIGGTARNISLIHQRKINYPLAGLHQYEMSFASINEVTSSLKPLTNKQRQMVEGLSRDRADIIIPAAEAIFTLMDISGSKTFIMSNKGLRDGLFYEELLNQLNIDYIQNVAEESLYQLTQDYEINIDHVKYISKLATQLSLEIKDHFQYSLSNGDLHLLHLSCRVLYLGEFISHEASSQHTFYLLTNRSIEGLSHIERLKIALIASFKSRNFLNSYITPYKHWFPKEEIEKLELLGSILKFCYSLNRTKRQVVSHIKSIDSCTNNQFILKLFCTKEPFFEELQAQKFKKHLEKSLKKTVNLEFIY